MHLWIFNSIIAIFQVWETVPEQMRCEAEWEGGEVSIGGRDVATLSLNASCGGLVGVMEHVHVSVDISSNTRRGLFSIELQSPAGTVSQLLAPRPLDNSLSGEQNK